MMRERSRLANLFLLALLICQSIHSNGVTAAKHEKKKGKKRLRYRKVKTVLPKNAQAANRTEDFHPIILSKPDVAQQLQRRMYDIGVKNKPKRRRKLRTRCYSNFNDLRRDMQRRNYAEGRTFRICSGNMQASGPPIRLNANDVTVECVRDDRSCRWINQGLSGRFLAVRGTNFAMYDMDINGRGKTTNGNGGCIAIQNNAEHAVERTTFRNCVTNANGGAISSIGSLSLRNSDFVNCEANNRNGIGGPAYIKLSFRSVEANNRSSGGVANRCPNGIYFETSNRCRDLDECEHDGGNRNPIPGGSGNCVRDLDDVRDALERDTSGGVITLCTGTYNVRETIVVNRSNFRLGCRTNNRQCILQGEFSNGPIMTLGENVRNSIIRDITFRNGNNLNGDGNGGALQVNGFENGINNCLFDNNFAKFAGGAIYCNDRFSTTRTRIINNEFISNVAREGGACYMEPAIQSENNVARGGNRGTGQCDEIFRPTFGTCQSFEQSTFRSSPLGATPRIYIPKQEDFPITSILLNETSSELNETATEEDAIEENFLSSFTPTSTPLTDGSPTSPPSGYPTVFEDDEGEEEDEGNEDQNEDGVVYLEPVDFDPR